MSLDTVFQAGLTAIIAAHGGVTVRIGNQTGTGLRVISRKQIAFDEMGQGGMTMSTVRVSADDFNEPARGANMIVDGQQVYVLECRTSGGVRVIECSDTQPVEGV